MGAGNLRETQATGAPPCWTRLALAALFLLAFALRAGYCFLRPEPLATDLDSLEYLAMARNLARGDGYYLDDRGGIVWGIVLRAYRIPGYSFFLSLVFRAFGENLQVVRFLQCLLGAATVLLVWALGDRFSRGVAWVWAAAAAVYPDLVLHASSILAECLHTFLLVGAILLLLRARGARADLLAGLGWGAATMTKTNALVLLPFVWGWFLLHRPLPVALRRAVVVTLGFALLVGPWVARNWAVLGAPILNSDLGRVLWEANNPHNTRGTGGDITMPFHRYHHLDEVGQSRAFQKEGMDYLRSLPPARLALFLLRKMGGFLYPFHARYDIAFGLAFPLWILGMLRALLRRDGPGLLLVAVSGSFLLGSAVGPGNPRFREILSPFLLVQAADGAAWALDSFRARRRVLAYLGWALLQPAVYLLDGPLRILIKRIVL